jgi:hypothetical protein
MNASDVLEEDCEAWLRKRFAKLGSDALPADWR